MTREGRLHDLARDALMDTDDAPMLWDSIDFANPDERIFGDYELLERIGRGGMGVVFRARQISLDREVAVKFIVGNLAERPDAIARFLDEARAAARLHHPHIVPVFEVGVIEGMHFFSMPFLSGKTLADRIAEKPPNRTETVALVVELVSAVAYAHSLSLLHLDLKPANVLFDDHGRPMISDFGLARRMDDDGTIEVQGASGTMAYMAPEQTGPGSHRLSACSDIYALGAILHEMLTGHAPSTAVDPLLTDASIEDDLDAICMHCLQSDPALRYATAADLLGDLERYRRGDDVLVRRPPLIERMRRSTRRHPAIALAVVSAMFVLCIGLVTTTWQWQRAERQSERTKQLAGLMAAAFPSGNEGGANSARNAVAWLKKNTTDDAAARAELLAAFQQSLIAAGKRDTVRPLLNETIDQLGADDRARQIGRLAQRTDRDSLVAAVLIGIPRGAESASSVMRTTATQKLADLYPSDATALYTAALACNVQPAACARIDYFEHLTAAFPDNVAHWLVAPKSDDDAVADHILRAAAASEFDDHLGTLITSMRNALDGEPISDALLLPMQAIVGDADAAPSLRHNAVDNVALPIYEPLIRVCKLDSAAIQTRGGLKDACVAVAEKALHSNRASILAKMIGSAILRRLQKGTPLETEAKDYRRQYVWLSEHAPSSAHDAELLEDDIIRFGEWEAWQRQAERAGVSRVPPVGWAPSDPQVLLLSEERKKP